MRSQREKQTKSKIRAKNSDNGVPDSPNVVEKWGKQVEGWFAQAKPDDNGRVNGHDAVAFFKRSGLDYDDLAKVWDKVVPPKDDKMDRRQFESALKLVALLQTGGELSDKTAVEAIAQAVPDPEPVIGPLERSPSPSLIPCPPCLNPHAGETGWLSKKAYVSSRLPAGDDRIGKTPSGSARSTVAENGAARSRSFTGMPSSRYNDEGASHKTPGKGEQPPPSNERIRSASMPGRLNEDPDQLGRPATGALRFVRLDKKVVKSSTMPKGIGGGRPGLAVAAERDEHPVEDEYVGDVDEEWTVLSDRVDRGKEQRAVNKSRRGNNRTPGTAVPFMDGRVYGLGTQSAPASAYNSLIAGARPLEGSLEDVKEQANRDSPIPDRLDSADEHVARGSPIPKRRASADYYVGKGGHKSGRSPQGSDYPDNDVAKPARSTVADDRRGRTRNVLDGSQPVDDVLARELPVPGQSKTENDAAGGRQSPGRVAADAGPVPGTSGMTVDKGATQGSPSPGRGGEREARTGTGSTTSGRPADANVPEVKTRTRPRRFEEMHDDERGGVPPGRFAEAEEQVNNNNSVNSVSAGDLAPRGVSMHSRSVAIIPYDEDDEDSRDHPERLGYNPERPMLRSFTPTSLGGRSSRSQTPAFSDDIMSQLAGSDLTKDAQEPCTAGLVNVELRLPPLRPTTSAKLTKVAAVNGSLVAFPSVTGGLLQWIGIQDSLDGTRDLARWVTGLLH
ncbi:unnamed protein product [Ostreobium quekettii]|uniref:EH domain-containing protein n=1 Tax=Ostreobium quekettii TaxID=121088 RepID=A0A8S1J1M4_9CHLO|nr:unnamed protein product [Ostreobium quekettii]